MSDYLHQKGYIYPLGKLSKEESNALYKKIGEDKTINLDRNKFILEYMGNNDYLLWLTYSSYGEKSSEFGTCRPCTDKEIESFALLFRQILGKIDTSKLKYIDFCYYNSTECTVDYYLGEDEYKPMTLSEAIKHCKEITASKCGKCGKEHAQLAVWLQKLADYEDETPITRDYMKSVCNNLKKNDYIELSFGEYDEDDFYILVQYINDVHEMCTEYDPVMQWKCPVHTVGQLRMFMTICGFGDFAQQLKS